MGGRVRAAWLIVAFATGVVVVQAAASWIARLAFAAGWSPLDVLELAALTSVAGALVLGLLLAVWSARDRARARRRSARRGGYVRLR